MQDTHDRIDAVRLKLRQCIREVSRYLAHHLVASDHGQDRLGNLVLQALKLIGVYLSDQIRKRTRQSAIDTRIDKVPSLFGKEITFKRFLDASWQAFIDEVIYFSEQVLARDKYLLEKRKGLVIVVNLSLDQTADLITSPLRGGDLGKMVSHRSDLLIRFFLEQGYGVRCEHFSKRRRCVAE